MKKFSILLLAVTVVFAFSFAGCDFVTDMIGGGGGDQPPAPAPPTPAPAPTPTTPTPAPAPTPGTGGVGGLFTESGYLNGPGDSYNFTVNAGTQSQVDVTFDYPYGSVDFWVKVVGEDGYSVLGDFDLDNGEIIQLLGGGTFYLTIYSRMGAGYWSGTYNLTGSGGGTTTGPGTGTSSCNVSGNSAWGYLNGPGDYCDWSIYAQTDYIEVVFDYPVGSVDFWVEVVGEDGYTVLGDFDLDNGEIIQLMGGGTFYMTVYSNYGAGNWSAAW